MDIRDARADEAAAIVEHATGDVDPDFLLRQRTVRVAIDDNLDGEIGGETDGVGGFLAFDVRPDAVHVTRLGGSRAALSALLDDVIAFAAAESLPLEAVVPADGETAAALEAKGFEVDGSGPQFEGRETTRYEYPTGD